MANKGMSKKGKIVLGSIAGFVALGVGTFFLVRNIKKNKSSSNSQGGGSGETSGDVGKIFKIGNIDARPNNVVLGIYASQRTDVHDTTKYRGDSVVVEGTDTSLDGNIYTIVSTWKDANGMIGAIYIDADSTGIEKRSNLSGVTAQVV